MQREDDVLLQAVAISQSILFFAVNLAEENGSKLIISALIVIFAGSFYILRAYAKIKDSAKYRYYSMLALALVIGDTVYGGLALVTFQSTLLSSPLFPLSSATIRIYLDYIFLAIPIFLFDFFGRIFKKRYGYKTS